MLVSHRLREKITPQREILMFYVRQTDMEKMCFICAFAFAAAKKRKYCLEFASESKWKNVYRNSLMDSLLAHFYFLLARRPHMIHQFIMIIHYTFCAFRSYLHALLLRQHRSIFFPTQLFCEKHLHLFCVIFIYGIWYFERASLSVDVSPESLHALDSTSNAL